MRMTADWWRFSRSGFLPWMVYVCVWMCGDVCVCVCLPPLTWQAVKCGSLWCVEAADCIHAHRSRQPLIHWMTSHRRDKPVQAVVRALQHVMNRLFLRGFAYPALLSVLLWPRRGLSALICCKLGCFWTGLNSEKRKRQSRQDTKHRVQLWHCIWIWLHLGSTSNEIIIKIPKNRQQNVKSWELWLNTESWRSVLIKNYLSDAQNHWYEFMAFSLSEVLPNLINQRDHDINKTKKKKKKKKNWNKTKILVTHLLVKYLIWLPIPSNKQSEKEDCWKKVLACDLSSQAHIFFFISCSLKLLSFHSHIIHSFSTYLSPYLLWKICKHNYLRKLSSD